MSHALQFLQRAAAMLHAVLATAIMPVTCHYCVKINERSMMPFS